MRRILCTIVLLSACGGGGGGTDESDARPNANVDCQGPDDCAGDLVCADGECVAPTCDDDILSSGESDIDCGGTACPGCTEGQSCGVPADCVSAFCDGGVCRDCEVAEDCGDVPGTLCIAGVCRGDAPLGQACEGNAQCESGFCIDGVCCDSRCSGLCESCVGTETGATSGTCSTVTINTDPAGECSTGLVSACGQNGMCDGSGACALYSQNTICAPDMCVGNTYTFVSRCDGAGTCEPGESFPCNCGSGICEELEEL